LRRGRRRRLWCCTFRTRRCTASFGLWGLSSTAPLGRRPQIILVAKRWVDVDEVRSRAPDEVMQRFRRDAHEVVDLLMDLVTVGVQSAESIASRAVEIANTETQPADPGASPPKGQKQNRKPA